MHSARTMSRPRPLPGIAARDAARGAPPMDSVHGFGLRLQPITQATMGCTHQSFPAVRAHRRRACF
ncbi:hypothetical protein DFR36_101279 [Melaminivora alkalimesophila]|uniref:Uncharacterized protein n=1 Tax=Melaminivora alkalimesophila TaxID=1165852 RepID=A0A317RJY0_9BURK|nr:hypothetical protein DFR36_101279 [Melaminivora alkalimesophila]